MNIDFEYIRKYWPILLIVGFTFILFIQMLFKKFKNQKINDLLFLLFVGLLFSVVMFGTIVFLGRAYMFLSFLSVVMVFALKEKRKIKMGSGSIYLLISWILACGFLEIGYLVQQHFWPGSIPEHAVIVYVIAFVIWLIFENALYKFHMRKHA